VGIAHFPNAANRANGVTVGSVSGGNQCRGAFEDLDTYNYELSAATILSDYQAGDLGDADGDGLANWEESLIYHTDPHNPDTDGDGAIDQAFKVFVTRPRSNSTIP